MGKKTPHFVNSSARCKYVGPLKQHKPREEEKCCTLGRESIRNSECGGKNSSILSGNKTPANGKQSI